ncbi:MAG: DUF4065 domain-containing protein [Synergistaceae bacterium]|jgi:uncharacterized phage-associated protein|nr:DUF4065 domain-containing protein [Synergistaceae bacterium]
MSTYSAIEVACWILSEAADRNISLSNMQLQKNLYYAQGYLLGMCGEKLFDDPIMAWEHGPVVPSVYSAYKKHGRKTITPPPGVVVPEELRGLIRLIVSEKSILSASTLRKATHEEMPYATTPGDEEKTPQKLGEFFVDMFWASDEEDAYEPSFDTVEEEKRYFLENLSADEREAIFSVCR